MRIDEATTIDRLPVRHGDPIRSSPRLAGVPNPELIWTIVALVVWIVLLGTISPDS
jgi:hypothetical protein